MSPIDEFFIAYSKANSSFEYRFFISFNVIVGLVKNMLIFSLFKTICSYFHYSKELCRPRGTRVTYAPSEAWLTPRVSLSTALNLLYRKISRRTSRRILSALAPLHLQLEPLPPAGANGNRRKISPLISTTDTLCQGTVCNSRNHNGAASVGVKPLMLDLILEMVPVRGGDHSRWRLLWVWLCLTINFIEKSYFAKLPTLTSQLRQCQSS